MKVKIENPSNNMSSGGSNNNFTASSTSISDGMMSNRNYDHRSRCHDEQSPSSSTTLLKAQPTTTTTATVIRQPQKKISTLESESASRPLSLYDNLSALVASLRPPHLALVQSQQPHHTSQSQISIGGGSGGDRPRSNVDKTVNVQQQQEDFLFSDITFKFPELFGAISVLNNNSNKINNNNVTSDNKLNNKNYNNNNDECLRKHIFENMDREQQEKQQQQSPQQSPQRHSHQYVNIDDSFISKPVISDAKSTFFGLAEDGGGGGGSGSGETSAGARNRDDDRKLCEAITHPLLQQDSPSSANGIVSIASTSDNNAGATEDNGHHSRYSEPRLKSVSYVTPEHDAGGPSTSKPSQEVYMATTVPQNIKGSDIMGRHTPTRNSLRYSRMLVVNKHFQDRFVHSNPMSLAYPGLAKFLLFFQILSGVLTSCIGLWIVLWAPHTRLQDNPYWSGLFLVFAGALGMILLDFRRSARQRLREKVFKGLKFNSVIITIVAGCLALAAAFFATIHYMHLRHADRDCKPSILFTLASECLCVFGLDTETTNHKPILNPDKLEIPVGGYEFLYKDLSCMEVRDGWRYILLASAICNLVGFLAVVFYLVLFCFKNSKRKYNAASAIRTNNIT